MESNTIISIESFDSLILRTIIDNQVIDIYDPATPDLAEHMPPSLKREILLKKSRLRERPQAKCLFVIASVNEALDRLTHPDEERREEQHLMVAEAVACMDPITRWNGNKDIDAEMKAQNLLSGAIVLGDLRLVKQLLEEQSPGLYRVKSESPYFGWPLHLAAAWGHLEIVRHLLDCGADPRTRSYDIEGRDFEYWERSWYRAIQKTHVYRAPTGSALRAAVLGGHEDIVRLLLEPEYRLPTTKTEYFRAVLAGARGGYIHLIQLLLHLTGKILSDIPDLGEDILCEAVRHNQEKVVQMVLDRGGHISKTVLCIATAQGSTSMVKFLLKRCPRKRVTVDVPFFDLPRPPFPRPPSPIGRAALGGHQGVVEILLKHDASPVIAFISATLSGQAHLIKWLLDEHPDLLSIRDPGIPVQDNGKTIPVGDMALLLAIQSENPTVISLLIDAGISRNHKYISVDFPIIAAQCKKQS